MSSIPPPPPQVPGGETIARPPDRPDWARLPSQTREDSPATLAIDQYGAPSVGAFLWTRTVLERGYEHLATADWYTSAADLSSLGEGMFSANISGRGAEIIIDRAGTLVRVQRDHDGEVHISVAAQNATRATQDLDMLRERLPARELDDADPRVPVTFWSNSPHGPQGVERMIDVPAWEDVHQHYPQAIDEQLDGGVMSRAFAPGVGGQIILWQGDPGTGKTYALRALLWEWRKWATAHYITDPEDFFGQSAAYMMGVILGGGDGGIALGKSDGEQPDERAKGGKWRLLILEDAGELMAADARERTGQGLSRLLNVVDGLIGQGLKVLVLVTTNEDVKKLHPAITRPGRCASVVRFESFDLPEAAVWIAERGGTHADLDGDDRTRWTIADLFAIAERRKRPEAAQRSMGFA